MRNRIQIPTWLNNDRRSFDRHFELLLSDENNIAKGSKDNNEA